MTADDKYCAELCFDRVKDVPRSILLLLRNPTFVLLTLASAMDALIINGFTTFGPKFVQFIYGMRASDAGLYFGEEQARQARKITPATSG